LSTYGYTNECSELTQKKISDLVRSQCPYIPDHSRKVKSCQDTIVTLHALREHDKYIAERFDRLVQEVELRMREELRMFEESMKNFVHNKTKYSNPKLEEKKTVKNLFTKIQKRKSKLRTN